MRFLTLLGPFALFGILGCVANPAHPTNVEDHWNMKSIGPRMGRAFLGYDRERDGNFDDFQWREKQDINLTMRRHFFNENPENPFQPESDYYARAVKPSNTLTRPVTYIHLEGIALGACLYGAGAPFIVLPIDSILGSFETFDTNKKDRPRVAITSSLYEDIPENK